MNKWTGSAGICINEEGKLLMVLQGAPDEEKNVVGSVRWKRSG